MTQSSIAVTADSGRWLLVNASPDVRTQLSACPALAPPEGTLRGSPIAAVLLTNADIDHAAGLLVLREGGAPPIYSTEAVRVSLTDELSILPTLAAFGPLYWRPLTLDAQIGIEDADDGAIGIRVTPFAVAGKPPLYVRAKGKSPPGAHSIGLLIDCGRGTKRVAYLPGVAELTAEIEARLREADIVLIDGTFAHDDELTKDALSPRTASMMGHIPLLAPDGLLARLADLPQRRILIHINNTNPIWDPASSARRAVVAAGVEVAYDTMELELDR